MTVTRFAREMEHVFNMYAYEQPDSLTVKHMNEYAQSRVPGPYKFYLNSNLEIEILFEWEDKQQELLWALQWL